jgi:hypothetical protein
MLVNKYINKNDNSYIGYTESVESGKFIKNKNNNYRFFISNMQPESAYYIV